MSDFERIMQAQQMGGFRAYPGQIGTNELNAIAMPGNIDIRNTPTPQVGGVYNQNPYLPMSGAMQYGDQIREIDPNSVVREGESFNMPLAIPPMGDPYLPQESIGETQDREMEEWATTRVSPMRRYQIPDGFLDKLKGMFPDEQLNWGQDFATPRNSMGVPQEIAEAYNQMMGMIPDSEL